MELSGISIIKYKYLFTHLCAARISWLCLWHFKHCQHGYYGVPPGGQNIHRKRNVFEECFSDLFFYFNFHVLIIINSENSSDQLISIPVGL